MKADNKMTYIHAETADLLDREKGRRMLAGEKKVTKKDLIRDAVRMAYGPKLDKTSE